MTGSSRVPSTGQSLRTPALWTEQAQQQFFAGWHEVNAQPLLICDYDGTLAPFRDDKMQAYPYDGVADRLHAIAEGPTRLALVSGRPTEELITLLPLAATLELWGSHGREHRTPDGATRLMQPNAAQRRALDKAQSVLGEAGWATALERKSGSLAMHWRGVAEHTREQMREAAEQAFAPHAGQDSLAVLPFDGGLELRAEDQTKGHAIAALLGEVDARTAAFLGDDFTDEDGFNVLSPRGGLSLLVREQSRASHADFLLPPPQALLQFLDAWQHASARFSSRLSTGPALATPNPS